MPGQAFLAVLLFPQVFESPSNPKGREQEAGEFSETREELRYSAKESVCACVCVCAPFTTVSVHDIVSRMDVGLQVRGHRCVFVCCVNVLNDVSRK